jgi:hypothetical protein
MWGGVGYGTVQYSTVQYSTVQYFGQECRGKETTDLQISQLTDITEHAKHILKVIIEETGKHTLTGF